MDMLLNCIAYRFHFEEWPTRLELGPDALRPLKARLSEENFARLRGLFDRVTLASDPDDVHSRTEIRFSGPSGAFPVAGGPGFPALRTKAELDKWNRCEAETRTRLFGQQPRKPPGGVSRSLPTALDNGQRSPRKLLRVVVARLLGRKSK
jgi:hypothetical protein